MADLPGPSLSGGVTNSDGSSNTIGTSGSKTSSTTDVTNTINNLVKQLQESVTSSDTKSASDTTNNQSTTGTSSSTSTGTTVNTGTTSSDASSIALSKGIAAQALSNSVDESKTDGLVGNIINQAAIAFAPTRVATNNTGSYNSTSVGALSDNARALATGTAASAVLNYQTAQQQIANSASGDLLNATKTTTGSTATTGSTTGASTSDTTGNTNTTGSTDTTGKTDTSTNTDTQAKIDTITKLLQTVFSNSSSNTNTSQTGESAGFKLTIICTTLALQEKLDKKSWVTQMRKFQSYPEYGKQGYYIWARPCVRELQQHPESVKSKFITRLFLARARGFIPARCFVTLTSFLLGLYWLVFLRKEFTKEAQLSLFSE